MTVNQMMGARVRGAVLLSLAALGWELPAPAAGVVFSEIMYHPVDATNAPSDGDEYEFLEIRNAGPTSVDLSGASFSAGLTFTFPGGSVLAPGSARVIVRNRAAFTNRYPAAAGSVAGSYSGSLSNGGEKLTLKSAGGATLCSVTYGTGGPWPDWPDGEGCSLVLRTPDGEIDAATNWCASAEFNGTPGATGACHAADIVINEVLTHTDPPYEDAIELRNVTGHPIDVTGWYLSDHPAVRTKHRLTHGVIAAGGRAVVYEYQFNAASPAPGDTPFALSSSLGECVYLTAATAGGTLTRQVDRVSFEAAENGVSFGRYPDGAPGDLTAMALPTFGVVDPPNVATFRTGAGAPNSLPRVGPLVIGEIMYHPVDDDPGHEYIELLNVTTNTVPLFDPLAAGNTWRLSKAVDFHFPTNVSLAAGARLLVTGATNLETFRALARVPPAVAVFGPWTGRLDNAGESVRLYKPDPPDPGTGHVPYVLVDRVDYDDSDLWPGAPDGRGPSLERLTEAGFGNSPTNWFTGAPGGSAGIAALGGFLNPAVAPASPAAGQSATVTVAVVARGALPTNVTLRVETGGAVESLSMRDDGAGGGPDRGRPVYTAIVAGQPSGRWVHYRFEARFADGGFLELPGSDRDYIPCPSLTVRMSGGGVTTTVQPAPEWQTVSYSGIASHTKTFFFYLNGAGEALVDDLSVTVDGTERVEDVDFDTPLGGVWWTNGNHSASYREWLDDDSTYACHVVAAAAGSGFTNNVSARLTPSVAVGDVCQVSFRTRQVARALHDWLAYLVGPAPEEVVISEVMYHPGAADEAPLEYVELHNPAAVSVDLGGWRLDGTGFVLPAGVTLAPGGYLVCCGSTSGVQAAYGISNTVGNWPGVLKNGGETLRLRNAYGRIVDEAVYNDREPWPAAADGFGPSLERLLPAGNGSDSSSWVSSASDTGWRVLTWTQAVDGASLPLSLWLDYDGKCVVDDVAIRPLGVPTNLVANGGFDGGTNGWTLRGNHDLSRVKSGLGSAGTPALVIACSEMRVVDSQADAEFYLYGDAVSNVVQGASLAVTPGGTYEVSLRARRAGLAGRLFAAAGAVTNRLDFRAHGTPGRASGAATVTNPVSVAWVQPEYRIAPVGTGNTIRAHVTPAAGAGAVRLLWRSFGHNAYDFCDGLYTTNAMRDDGAAPDTTAGDGIFAATLPGIPGSRTFVRYRVEVETTEGFRTSSPRPDDPDTDHAYWVEGVSPQTHLPNWHLLADGPPMVYPISRHVCAVSPDGQTFTDVRMRHRGYANPNTNAAFTLRLNRGNPLDAWFGGKRDNPIFRNRGITSRYYYRRILNEPLAYSLQRDLGFPAPRWRHVCLWINGEPTITTELENPDEAFLEGNDIDPGDYVSMDSRPDRVMVGGNPALDNFDEVYSILKNVSGENTETAVRLHVWYEAVQQVLSFLSALSGPDQSLSSNMFQHRRAYDGRWLHYPWDWDIGFMQAYTNLHPYYATDEFPPYFSADTNGNLLAQTLFHPRSAIHTLPFRHRQQTALWRHASTLLAPDYLIPRLNAMEDGLKPAFLQLGSGLHHLTNQAESVRAFIHARRDFLYNGTWADKNPALWAPGHVYNPSNIVISEIMPEPLPGGEYIELFNAGTQAVDLSHWRLSTSNESYRLPHGTMMAPGSRLVVSDRQTALTNAFAPLAAAGLVRRCSGSPLWDEPIAWLSASEYATRVVEIPNLSLPTNGTIVELRDWREHLIDRVAYGRSPPWPAHGGASLELIDPRCDNDRGDVWSASAAGGTPGFANASAFDADLDGMSDDVERAILAASAGLTNIAQVLPGDDFDLDGVSNLREFIGGTDPTVPDAHLWALDLRHLAGDSLELGLQTFAPAGDAYRIYRARRYRLETSPSLAANDWTLAAGVPEWDGVTARSVHTNAPAPGAYYRFRLQLVPK